MSWETFWNDYGMEILAGLALLLIVILALVRRGQKGTWAEKVYVPVKQQEREQVTPSSTPKESRGETECRRVLESLFLRPFPRVRPNFLLNPITKEGNNLELDCYNEELKLAVEYNGIQHAQYVPYFHRTREAFQNQQYRDYVKKDLCAKNGVSLIVVPHTIKEAEIENYLKTELHNLGKI